MIKVNSGHENRTALIISEMAMEIFVIMISIRHRKLLL